MKKRKKAFSLVELMVSIVVLMATLPALLLGVFNYFALNEMTGDITTATEDARCVIEQMRSLAVISLASITSENWANWASNNGCNSLPSEQVQVIYTDRDISGNSLDDNPLAPTVNISWQRQGRNYNLSFATLITQR